MSDIVMKVVHRGQIRPFGDTYNVWEITTDKPEKEVLEFCKREILSNRYVPSKKEWDRNQNDEDMSYYFRGYYNLVEYKKGVWRFTRVLPYTD